MKLEKEVMRTIYEGPCSGFYDIDNFVRGMKQLGFEQRFRFVGLRAVYDFEVGSVVYGNRQGSKAEVSNISDRLFDSDYFAAHVRYRFIRSLGGDRAIVSLSGLEEDFRIVESDMRKKESEFTDN